MRRRTRPVLALVVVFLLLIAGCTGTGAGGGGEAGGLANGEATATPGEGASGATQGADTGEGTTASVNGSVSIHFINVGQGDSTLIVGPTGETILIDTGDFRDDGEYVIDYLESQNIDRIDALVSTHPDADHIGGNAAVIEHFETEGNGVGAVYDPGIAASTATYERYLDAVEQYDVPLYRTQTGDRVPLEGASVQVLGPPASPLADGERNENSIVLRLAFGQTSALLTGDAGPVEEPYLLETHGDVLDVTLLKAGHHGSRSSTSAALLEATTPKVVVVSSAYDSPYGHPHQAVLDRLASRATPTYWTGTHGTVVATTDGTAFEVATQVEATTRPADLRADAPVSPDTDGPVVVRDSYAGDGDSAGSESETQQSASTAITIADVNADAAGDDRENLNDEYVVLTNRGDEAVDISDWSLTDESGAQYTFADGTVLDAGASITVYTGSGSDTATEKYWDAGRPVWNNDGDTVTLLRPDGRVVTEVSY